jgi:hypothetical protein
MSEQRSTTGLLASQRWREHIRRPTASGWRAVFGIVLGFAIVGSVTADYSVSTATGNLLLTPNHGGDGSAWGKPGCANCHFLPEIHKRAPAIRGIVRRKGSETCTACHGSNGTAAARRCTVCHNNGDLPLSPIQTGRKTHDFTVSGAHALGDRECLTCHVKSDMDGNLEPAVDLTPVRDAEGRPTPNGSITDFCLRCHNRDHRPRGVSIRTRPRFGVNDPLTAIEDNYQFIDRHGFVDGGRGPYVGLRGNRYRYPDEVACTDCHVMHGTQNRKLILDDPRKGATRMVPSLRTPAYSVRVRNGNYAELCVLCHDMENPAVEQGALDAGNGLTGVHDVSSDCTECHTHGEPVKGGL